MANASSEFMETVIVVTLGLLKYFHSVINNNIHIIMDASRSETSLRVHINLGLYL